MSTKTKWVRYDDSGKITGVFENRTLQYDETNLPIDHPDIVAFLNPPKTYQQLRRMEYPPESDLIVALWEKVIENRPESADILQAQRLAVKEKYPKPE